MKSFGARVLAVVAALSLLGNVLLYLRYSTSRPLVTVGGQTITKKQYQDQLEHQAGQEVLNKLVFNTLTAQAAAREGVTPTAQDVDAQIAAIERRSPQMLTPYAQDPVKMAELRQLLQTSIALENLRIKDVALTPAEVAAYYAKHQSAFLLPQQLQVNTVVTQNAVDAATATDLLRQKTPPDVIARQPRLQVVGANGYNPDMTALPPGLKQQISGFVQQAPVGSTKTFRDQNYYLTFQVIKNSRATVPPLAQIRDQVERQARLERAPSQQAEMAHLYQQAKPVFGSEKYAAYFSDFQNYSPANDAGKKTASVP